MPQDYRKLEVWKVAHENVLAIYQATQDFPSEERFGITSQIRRAASSVTTNLAEGCGRESKKERLRFARIAQGSNSETKYLVQLAHDLGFLDRETAVQLHRQLTHSGRLLNGYTRWLNTDSKA